MATASVRTPDGAILGTYTRDRAWRAVHSAKSAQIRHRWIGPEQIEIAHDYPPGTVVLLDGEPAAEWDGLVWEDLIEIEVGQ